MRTRIFTFETFSSFFFEKVQCGFIECRDVIGGKTGKTRVLPGFCKIEFSMGFQIYQMNKKIKSIFFLILHLFRKKNDKVSNEKISFICIWDDGK